MTTLPTSSAKSARRKGALALLAALAALAATAIAVIAAPAKPDFSVAGQPTTQTVTTGQAASYDITVTRSGGFSNSITLGAVTGLPTETTATWPNGQTTQLLPATTTTTSTVRLTVQTGKSTPEGSYSLGITATSGRMVRSTTVTLVVQDPPLPTTFPINADLKGKLLIGQAQELDLALTNPFNQPLNVTNLSVAIGAVTQTQEGSLKGPCTAADFGLTQLAAGTTLTIPPNVTKTLNDLGVEKPTVTWLNLPDRVQNGCLGAQLKFNYSANGTTAK